jgi:T5SS/PEP-CTERM-associated repeat protein
MEPANPGNGLGFDVGVSFDSSRIATGTLVIEGGSTLEARNTAVINPGSTTFTGGYGNINIGRGYGSYGYATVTGTGSRMTTEGGAARITVGHSNGYGVLDIEQGGFVGAFNLTVGRDGGVGRINIDGVGSELKTSSAYGFYNGTPQMQATGYHSIGRGYGGRGYLSVTNGGVVNIENEDGISDRAFMRFGRDSGAYGYGIVSGAGSELNLTQNGLPDSSRSNNGSTLQIGEGGQGKLIVEQGGHVSVVGDGSFLGIGLARGSEAPSTNENLLEVRSGGTVLVDGLGYDGGVLIAGLDEGTNGRVAISGAGSAVTVQNDLDDSLESTEFGASVVIGYRGHGEL